MRQALCAAMLLLAGTFSASAQTSPAQRGPLVSTPDVIKDLAPTGKVRAAINLGNSVLAQKGDDGPKGITVDLARELGKQLAVPVELVTFEAAGKVFEAMKAGAIAVKEVQKRRLFAAQYPKIIEIL